MTATPPPSADPTMVAEFHKTRLTHTLEHTQRSTGQIYLVNGGVLALLYFVAGADTLSADAKVTTVVVSLIALAAVNLLHARLIHIQQRWYRRFSELYADAAGVSHPELTPRPLQPLSGTHRCYMAIHLLLGALALGLAAYVLRGGAGVFVRPSPTPQDDVRALVRTEVDREIHNLEVRLRSELAHPAPQLPGPADKPK